MKAETYIIDATTKMRYTVTFDEPVTFDEARELFMNDDFHEIHDEEPLEVLSVERTQQITS